MRFGTWNVRSLYSAGSLKIVAKGEKEVYARLSGCTGVQIGEGAHCKGRGLYVFLWKGK
jgi:hypothetical protein